MVTIKDVARLAKVSVATVSHVINGTRYVSDQARQKVLIAMDQLSYQPNAVARSLRKKESKIIGLILPDNTNPYFAEIAWSIEFACNDHGYSVILCNSDGDVEKEAFYINILIEKQVDGIILAAAGSSTANLLKLQDRKIPVVMVDRNAPNINTDSIQINNAFYGEMATEHLIELGHRNIACITGPRKITPSFDRVDGYLRALSKNNITRKDSHIIRGDFKPQGGYFAAKQLLDDKEPPTAIFACNDLMAYGVIHAVNEKGLRVPDDISVVGFDDIYLSSFISPPLTTIRQPRLEMGQEAVNSLLLHIQNPTRYPRNILLNAELVKRSSTIPYPRTS